MKEELQQIYSMLSQIEVKGNGAVLMAQSLIQLQQLLIKEDEVKE